MRGFDILLDPAGFDWREAPLSQWYWPAGTAIVYLLVVVAMLPGAVRAGDANTAAASEYRAWVKSMSPEALAALPEGKRKQDPRQLPAAKSWGGIMCWHNLVLFAWSAAMFAGCAYEILVRFGTEGGSAGFLFCEAPLAASDEASSAGTFDASERFAAAGGGAATGALYFWSYIYYLSKFYELFDTVLALAKVSGPARRAVASVSRCAPPLPPRPHCSPPPPRARPAGRRAPRRGTSSCTCSTTPW